MKKVYLAGGFAREGEVDWREIIHEAARPDHWREHLYLPNIEIFDPFKKERGDAEVTAKIPPDNYSYWGWDVFKIKEADIVFVYLQPTNPGVGTFVELGLAHGLGKHIIVVMERGNGDEEIPDRYRESMRWFADAYYEDFNKGVQYLQTL
jgi:nucleoside 2-deoxyribosyltransferase